MFGASRYPHVDAYHCAWPVHFRGPIGVLPFLLVTLVLIFGNSTPSRSSGEKFVQPIDEDVSRIQTDYERYTLRFSGLLDLAKSLCDKGSLKLICVRVGDTVYYLAPFAQFREGRLIGMEHEVSHIWAPAQDVIDGAALSIKFQAEADLRAPVDCGAGCVSYS